jgi:hypothetical protein
VSVTEDCPLPKRSVARLKPLPLAYALKAKSGEIGDRWQEWRFKDNKFL